MTIRRGNNRSGEPERPGPGHADPLPISGERHTRGGEATDDSERPIYWTDLEPEQPTN